MPSKPRQQKPAATRRFTCTFEVEIEVSKELLDSVLTEDWRKMFYRHVTRPEDVAEMLAYNLMQGSRLKQLDGFADQPEDRAKVLEITPTDVEEVKP